MRECEQLRRWRQQHADLQHGNRPMCAVLDADRLPERTALLERSLCAMRDEFGLRSGEAVVQPRERSVRAVPSHQSVRRRFRVRRPRLRPRVHFER